VIGDGSKIGGPPAGILPPVTQQTTKEVAKPAQTRTPKQADSSAKAPRDSFVKAESARSGNSPKAAAMGREPSGSTDLFRLARDNPTAARRMVATLASQMATNLSEVEKALAAVRQMLEKLAEERFAKEARKKMGEDLRAKREKLAILKRRMSMGARKMALLQQIAGKLGDPRLDEELDRILNHHRKLKTKWGKRHHLLSIGSSLYGEDAQTPQHLREVIKTDVRAGNQGEEASGVLADLSPRAAMAELIARTLDGSVREGAEFDTGAKRGELGRSSQCCALLGDAFAESLEVDPLGED